MSTGTYETDFHEDLFAYDETDVEHRQTLSVLEAIAPRVHGRLVSGLEWDVLD